VLNMMPLKAFAGQQHDAHLAAHLMMGMSPMLQANPQAAMMLQQHMLEHIRLKAEEAVEAELFQQYGTDPDRMVSVISEGRHGCVEGSRVHDANQGHAGAACWWRGCVWILLCSSKSRSCRFARPMIRWITRLIRQRFADRTAESGRDGASQ
jgi:hypothetical protein